MTDVATEAPANGAKAALPDAKPSSRLQELKDAFHEQITNPRLFKTLPAVKKKLVAEYRILTGTETQAALRSEDADEQNKDMLITALVALHARDPEHPAADKRGLVALERWLELDNVTTPLRFDTRLTDALDLPAGSAREIVHRLFDNNDIALGAQAAQLMAWMSDTSEESLQDFTPGS